LRGWAFPWAQQSHVMTITVAADKTPSSHLR
jgi:hypothetical protein